jgi:integrase/recombinase XerD
MSLPSGPPSAASRVAADATDAAVSERYAAALSARRLAPSTVNRYLQVAAHFTAWQAAEHHADLASLRQPHVEEFLVHLRHCTCRHRGRRTTNECRAALHHLLRVLDVPIKPARPITPLDEEVAGYDLYLRDVCGLADQTRLHRTRHVREFLISLFGDGPVRDEVIRPVSFAQFVTARVQRCRPGTAGVITDGLRSYVRYLQLQGRRTDGLRDGIPAVARWRLASLPVHLQPAELQRFLRSFNSHTPHGRRDYAMALCLTVLGLRAGEVAGLRLSDLDWRAGTVTIRETKTRRARTLPLTPRLGRALVSYLRTRPQTPSDHVFVRIGVLEGEPVPASLVRSAIRLGYQRAGLPAHHTGTHRLRHTAATRMIVAGASIKQVADVLGHASIDSTAIYAKVDLPRLRSVALPWTVVR